MQIERAHVTHSKLDVRYRQLTETRKRGHEAI